nr:MAG TPA: hypothetical protein [Caudoviricetes sp.]
MVSAKNAHTLLTYRTTGTRFVVKFPLSFRKQFIN